jgi:pilus assembly protein CpaC
MRTADTFRCALVVAWGCCWLGFAAAQAQVTRARDIKLVEGHGELLQFRTDVIKVSVSEPKIADAVIVSPREIMVNAKSPGGTTLMIWETGADPVRYEIAVVKDDTEWDGFLRQIQESGGGTVTATGSPESVVLAGSVKSAEESKRLAGMAQARTKSVVNLLRTPPAPELRQILLQVKIADVDRTALTQVGFNLFSTNPVMLGALATEQFAGPRFGALQTGAQVASGTASFSDLLNLFVFRPDLNMGATIKALEERNLLQILAEPNLIALEGKDASFLAGGSFPFPTITTTPTGGATAPVVTVQFKPFGIKLDFTPTVTAQGAIDLKVSPEVSSLDFSNAVTIAGFTIPALSTRRVESEMDLEDGQSFAIAGLIDNTVTQQLSKIPGIGDIPVLGKLFQSKSLNRSRNELLVVVTPRIVKPSPPAALRASPVFPVPFLPPTTTPKPKK